MDLTPYSSRVNKKLLNFIFIVDSSESMLNNNKIDAVNRAIKATILKLHEYQLNYAQEYDLKIAIMKFDENAVFIVEPTSIVNFNYNRISTNCKKAFFSQALELLNNKLSRKAYMQHYGKIGKPSIVLLTDGEFAESDDYNSAINSLHNNGWFEASERKVVLVGNDAINSDKCRDAVKGFVVNIMEDILCIEELEESISPIIEMRWRQTVARKNRSDYVNDLFDPNLDSGSLGGLDDLNGFELGFPDTTAFI